ncbi:MAG: alpha-1,4-glucan--maltose-1-phosphate maltosyltransferase [Alphaproteobacteria bacterium]|nr:alpha-1,4-glucan--maltose-1-phosphate maltosyltransferase [Alphaproteobacteria bacterium]
MVGNNVETKFSEVRDHSHSVSGGSRADGTTPALSVRGRIAIEDVKPRVDDGQFPVKRVVGGTVVVSADIFSDGHDKIGVVVRYRTANDDEWSEAPMTLVDNDRWSGSFSVHDIGSAHFTIRAWRDLFRSWHDDIEKKRLAGQPVSLETEEGRQIVETAAGQTSRDHHRFAELQHLRDRIETTPYAEERLKLLLEDATVDLMAELGPRANVTELGRDYAIWVDRPAAAFSAWYEMFPRSQSGDVRRHGTFDDVIHRLGYVRELGFDVLYFTPIHPIGEVNRKGKNNSLKSAVGEPGSPYAIGSRLGGHDAIHPELGTIDDFRRLVAAAHDHGLEIALDFAIQCAPDHPWITEHPEWFDWRPDGTIKFAENPPKKYEDIVNVHFYRGAFPSLWFALRDAVLHWVAEGVRIFRVDNPHTKPYPFWEWLIAEVHETHPDVIFLSEAFTRPKVMKRLAKIGFSQSYTYFTWRNTKAELIDYLTELTRTSAVDYYRPNFFTNTPDINPHFLQSSGRAGYQSRLVLAATLAGNYGIYNGFELCEGAGIPGKEEYLDSEKYEIRVWDWDREGHIKDDVRLVNRLRRTQPALQQFADLEFYNAWNDSIIYYGKRTADRRNFILVAVNLDPHEGQGAHFEVPLWEFGLPDDATIGVEDLASGHRFTWTGKIQHVWLDPNDRPYRIWRLIPPGEVQS